ncbi:MAG: hypothetical protein K2H20_00635 [Bacilli bacterium]|nr:hypothetical protein [Bacilli bacterium]
MKNKKRIVSLALSGMISMGMLAGCGAKDVQAEVSTEPEVIEEVREIVEANECYFEQYYEVPEARTFEPGEHVIFIRYNYVGSAGNFTSGRVDVPEGYTILNIENYTERDGYGSQTSGVDVWFINNEIVLVEPVYKNEIRNDNSRRGYYDYSLPGKVIEKEQTDNMKLTK